MLTQQSVLRELPKPVLHTVRSGAFTFSFQYPLVSLGSFNSCLLIPRCFPTTSIFSFVFPSIIYFMRHFLRQLWPIQLAFLLSLLHRKFLSALSMCNTYSLLTPRCRVLLEKLTALQLVKKFPAFHGTRRFITALTSVRHLSLSWASPIQSIYPHPTSWKSILILSTHLRLGLPSGLLPSGFPCNISSFLTRSVQFIFSILLQHHISELHRYFWSISEVSKFHHYTKLWSKVAF